MTDVGAGRPAALMQTMSAPSTPASEHTAVLTSVRRGQAVMVCLESTGGAPHQRTPGIIATARSGSAYVIRESGGHWIDVPSDCDLSPWWLEQVEDETPMHARLRDLHQIAPTGGWR